MLKFTCVCGKRLQANEGDEGKRFRCPGCRSVVVVPEETPLTAEVVEDVPEVVTVATRRTHGMKAGHAVACVLGSFLFGAAAVAITLVYVAGQNANDASTGGAGAIAGGFAAAADLPGSPIAVEPPVRRQQEPIVQPKIEDTAEDGSKVWVEYNEDYIKAEQKWKLKTIKVKCHSPNIKIDGSHYIVHVHMGLRFKIGDRTTKAGYYCRIARNKVGITQLKDCTLQGVLFHTDQNWIHDNDMASKWLGVMLYLDDCRIVK